MDRKYLVDEYPISEQTAIELMDGARKLLGLEWLIWDNCPSDDPIAIVERRDEIIATLRPSYIDIEPTHSEHALVYVAKDTPAQLLVNENLSDAYLVPPEGYGWQAARETSVIHLMGNYGDTSRKPITVFNAFAPDNPRQAQDLKDFLKQLGIEILE